jgi:hypothetical protein
MKSGTGKPPGTSNFNIEFDNEVEVLESLPLGMMELDAPEVPVDNWRQDYPEWDQLGVRARPVVGDCYAMMAEYILTLQQPYPGDGNYTASTPPYERFEITKRSPNLYLANPYFDLSGWYARRRSQALNLPRGIFPPFQMGCPLDYVTTRLLTSAIESHFPSINPDLDPESRFYVHQFETGSNVYIIEDVDLELQTRISKLWLEDPTFNLVNWYLQLLENEHQYSEKYEAKQLELYYLEQESNGSLEFDPALADPLSDEEVGSVNELENSPDPHGLEERQPCPCIRDREHTLVTCLPDLESVSDSSLYGEIDEFNWDHTDDFRDTSVWPDRETAQTPVITVYSDQWMLGFMGNVFTSRQNRRVSS